MGTKSSDFAAASSGLEEIRGSTGPTSRSTETRDMRCETSEMRAKCTLHYMIVVMYPLIAPVRAKSCMAF